MIDDFIPIIRDIPGNDPVKIYPIADLHIGSQECRIDAWTDFVKKLKSEPRSYIAILGDMFDNGIINSKTSPYSQTMRPLQQKLWLVEQLTPIREKILCIVPGNHEARNDIVDQNPLYDVAAKLNLEELYRENGAFLILRIGSKKTHTNPTYTGLFQHGTGGGTAGAQANKLARYGMAFEGLDFIVSGHTHKPIDMPATKLYLDPHNKRVIEKPFRVVSATSWLRYGGYGFRKQYVPGAYALQEMILDGRKKQLRVLQ